ncbi:hypothetical protein [Phyllobacterium myrsinacearum]|jgi:hypothetical protein|uniref:hypothetical protein n=1 Tax=Phyllobacterium myrsinacearum TaxID=28101 RepID=UPI00102A731C|nr:hypothetical protein [Phyllobacterium myrsinacearum]RZS88433.1 hypothetical protein EV217_0818 [Phyllobacterium myrsinacearum]
MDICTFWYGPRLREVDRVCLASMVMTGQRVKLYAFDEIANLPKGIEICDAAPILDKKYLRRIDPDFPDIENPGHVVSQFSDLFRVTLMKKQQGLWLDTDIYLMKQFHPATDKPYLARENHFRLGVSAMYLPPDNPVIGEFDAYMEGTVVVPPWLGFRRRVMRPAWFRMTGQKVTPATIGITAFANDGISRMAKRYGFFKDAAPKENFYYWTARDALRIFDPAYGLEPLDHPDFIGFHVHKKDPTNQPLVPGSFYHWAANRVADYL